MADERKLDPAIAALLGMLEMASPTCSCDPKEWRGDGHQPGCLRRQFEPAMEALWNLLIANEQDFRAKLDRWNEAVKYHRNDKLVQIPKGGAYYTAATAIAIRANLTGAGD